MAGIRKLFVFMSFFLACAFLVCALFFGTASAEFDVTLYSYDELVEIRQAVNSRIEEMDREYALEHADRSIDFEEAERVVYLGESIRYLPSVTAITEDAPENTVFVWRSSDPEVAKVSDNGTVKALSRGDAVITAAASDNQYLTASYTVHAAVPVENITVWGPMEPLYLSNNTEEALYELGFSIEPEDAYYQEVIWSTSDETIASVDESGNLQGLLPGRAVITAMSAGDTPKGKRPVKTDIEVTVLQAVTAIEVFQPILRMNVGDTTRLTLTVQPENAGNQAVVFTSSNPEIATVDKSGSVHAAACGECDILCEAADGHGASGSSHVIVTKQINRLGIAEELITLPIGGTHIIEVTIDPEDATEKGLIWTSTNVFVARVAAGKVEAVGQGDCVITCTTMDGSKLSAEVKVHVPTFSVESTEYTVTEKQGLMIPVIRNQKDCEVYIESETECFTVDCTDEGFRINPIAAGTGVIMLSNPEAPADFVQIQITIENSAVFNQESYPAISYMELARMPELYEDAQISAYGKILHVTEDENNLKTFMVGTGGENYTDQVIWVRCDPALLPEETTLTGGKMVTVYGLFHLDRSYSEILQAETTVPALDAEKIVAEPAEKP